MLERLGTISSTVLNIFILVRKLGYVKCWRENLTKITNAESRIPRGYEAERDFQQRSSQREL